MKWKLCFVRTIIGDKAKGGELERPSSFIYIFSKNDSVLIKDQYAKWIIIHPSPLFSIIREADYEEQQQIRKERKSVIIMDELELEEKWNNRTSTARWPRIDWHYELLKWSLSTHTSHLALIGWDAWEALALYLTCIHYHLMANDTVEYYRPTISL